MRTGLCSGFGAASFDVKVVTRVGNEVCFCKNLWRELETVFGSKR